MFKMKKNGRRFIALIVSLIMCIAALPTTSLANQSDLTGHWAGKVIQEWIDKGLANGYPDGSFKPDNNITRAEFMALVNKAFKLTEETAIDYKDVSESKWYYSVVKAAKAAGYINGYPNGTMQPESSISRQEVAIIICIIKNLQPNTSEVNSFTDASSIANWSRGYIGAAAASGYMKGYPDGSFNAFNKINRAEAITALNNAMKVVNIVYDKAGTYGPSSGSETVDSNVTVKADGVVLQNLRIKGDLVIAEEVGDGNVTLNNIIVDGDTIVRGGGINSIHINGGQYNELIVQKTSSGQVRIVAKDAKGIVVIISENAAGQKIVLEGAFDKVSIDADNVDIKTQGSTNIKELEITAKSEGSNINLGSGTEIMKLIKNTVTNITGNGVINQTVDNTKTPQDTNNNGSNNGGTGGGQQIQKQTVTGTISPYSGSPVMTEVLVQLKQNINNVLTDVGNPVHPNLDGTYTIGNIVAGTGYVVTASLEGYYDFSSVSFAVTEGTNITGKNLTIQRKEPIITSPTHTIITKGSEDATIVIDLSAASTLGDTFAVDAINPDNWTIETGDTGLSVDTITRDTDTKVTINFTGTADKSRIISIKAKEAAITSTSNEASNTLDFCVAEDDMITSSNLDLDTYYAKNLDVDGDMKAVVVIVHGLAEHLGRYNYVVETLNEEGYGVYRLDNKGHGKTERTNIDGNDIPGYVEDYNEYLDDVNIIVEKAKTENPGAKVYTLGHSMGGYISALYSMKYPTKLAGQILSGPAVAAYNIAWEPNIENPNSWYELNKLLLVNNSLTSTVCRDKAVQEYYFVDPLRLTQYARKLNQEWIDASVLMKQDVVSACTYPTLVLHGGDDRIVSQAGSLWFYNTIGSNDKERIVYEGLYHEIFNEKEKDEVLGDVTDWLNERCETYGINGSISLYVGNTDLTGVSVQLKKDGVNVGDAVSPNAEGTYTIPSVIEGSGYTVTATLEGYYNNATLAFAVEDGNLSSKNLIMQRVEPIITSSTYTTITTGAAYTLEAPLSVEVELSPANGLGDTFAEEAVVTNLANWTIDTGTTGLTVDSIERNSDSKVTINFTGTGDEARAFTIQANEEAIISTSGLPSNIFVFSLVDDGFVQSSNPELDTYYAKNLDVDGEMKAVVIMVHGLAEHLGRYNYVSEAFNQAGYGVYRLDNKGHGRTEKTVIDGVEVPGYVEDYNEYMDDINIIVDMAMAENPGKKVFILGHSMGGRLAAAYGEKYPGKIDGQILSGPAVKMQDGYDQWLEGANDSPYDGAHATELLNNSLAATVCRDAAIRAQYSYDSLNLLQYAKKLQQEYRIDAGVYLRDHIADYEYPVLVIHGADDRIVPTSFSQWFVDNISSTDVERILYDDCYHEILNERIEKDEVMQDILEWLNDRD